MAENTQFIITLMQIILSFGNICILAYAFIKFINKPHDTLETRHNDLEKRVDKHELRLEDIDKSLRFGNDHFREQDTTNEVLIHSVLALIEFGIQYCLVEHKEINKGLEKAKDDLNNYLARK